MRIVMTTLSAALLCTLVGVSLAQSPQNPQGDRQPANQQGRQGGQQGGPQFDAARFLKDHDANNDGKLTKDELPKQLQESFAECDKNGDGSLTQEELQKHAQEMASRSPELVEFVYWVVDVPAQDQLDLQELQNAYSTLRKMDANNDGTLDKQEVMTFRNQRRAERVNRAFEDFDKNKDKKISKDEARGLWADNFDQLDANHDGSLDEKEIDAAYNIKQDGTHNNQSQQNK